MRDLLRVDMSSTQYWNDGEIKNLKIEVGDLDFMFGELEKSSEDTFKTLATLRCKMSDENTNVYSPLQDDKLYFIPGTSVPRIKLRNLDSSLKIKSTRKIEDATAIFFSRKSYDLITDYNWEYAFETYKFKAFIEELNDNGCFYEERDFERLNEALEYYEHEVVITNYSAYRILTNEDITFNIPTLDPNRSSSRFFSFAEKYKELGKMLLEGNITANFYDESSLLVHLNGSDCVPINEDVYENIKDMLNSDDADNHVLAMEIMANCDYDESLLYLCMLMMEFSYVMENTKSKNHVNFKSYLSYMDLSPRYMRMDLDGTIRHLASNNKLNSENLNTLMKHQGKQNVYMSGSNIIQVQTVTLTEEYLKEMNSNYTYQIAPEITIEVEDEEIDENEELDYASTEEASIHYENDTEEELPATQDHPDAEPVVESNELIEDNGDGFTL